MLRSRSNRKQFPSESTDERHGHGRTLSDYNGYPSPKPISPLAVTIGCDDDIESSNYNMYSSSYSSPMSISGGGSNNNNNGVLMRRSPSYGSNGGTVGSPMAVAGSPTMANGGVGGGGVSAPGSNGSLRKSLPGYGTNPNPSWESSSSILSKQHPQQRRSNSGSSFGERIGSPIKSHQYYARRNRRTRLILGLAVVASFFGIVWTLYGGGGTETMAQYRKNVMHRLEREVRIAREQEKKNSPGGLLDGGNYRGWGRIWWKALFPTAANNDSGGEERRGTDESIGNNADVIIDHQHDLNQLQLQKHQLEQEIQMLETTSHKISAELQAQHTQLSQMQLKLQEEEARLIEIQNSNNNNNNRNDEQQHQQQLALQEQQQQEIEEALRERIKLLSDNLGKESRREAMERFGPGPHLVEVYVEFPQYVSDLELDQWPRVRGKLTLEMAPLELMPVAVNLFLQQIDHGLWNGCSFVVNPQHILQAGPHQSTPDGNEYSLNSAKLLNRFSDVGLHELPFQEYRDEFPHEQYTIGYAGRPGGRNWYINKVNNTINHGPGGQRHYSMNEDADPCFAKLVGGWDALDLIEKIPSDDHSRLVRPVVIVDSRVVGSREGHHLQEQGEHDGQHQWQHEEQYLQEHHQPHVPDHELQHEQHQDPYHSPEEQHERYEQHEEQQQLQYHEQQYHEEQYNEQHHQ